MAYVKRDCALWKFSTLQFDGYSCTKCHEKYPVEIKPENYKFCPQCGSKMVGIK